VASHDEFLLAAALAHRILELEDALAAVRAAKGPKGDPPKHEWDGSELRFENPDGTWGEWTNLRGPRGGGGGGRTNLDVLPAADDTVPDQFIVHSGGEWKRATYLQMQAWFPSGGVTGGGAVVTVNGEVVTVS
jgi:hypothetical protein